MVNLFRRSDKVKRVNIPNYLIKEVYEHPEDEERLCSTLTNGMYTDLFYDIRLKSYYTLTNNIELLNFIKKEKEKEENGSKAKVS